LWVDGDHLLNNVSFMSIWMNMLLGFVLIMNILEVCSFVRCGWGELYIAGCEILSGGVARTIYSGFLRKVVWVCIVYRFVGGVARTIYSGFLRKIVWVCIVYRFVGWVF
jgi:hypothetical protein